MRYFSLFFWLCLLGSSTLLANHHHHRRAAPAKPTRVAHRYHFTSPLYGQNALTQILNRLIQPNSRSAKIAVYVKSMRHGDILYAHSIYQSLAPASTLKILTAEAALLYLGPNYRFNTQLLTDSGTITNGVLQGNLYVVLSGDPTFTDDNLLELLSALRSKSIHAIAGNIYIDRTAYDQEFYGPGWKVRDKQYCYAAPISASIINRNCPSFYSKMGMGSVVNNISEYNRLLLRNAFKTLAITVYGNILFAPAPATLFSINNHYSEPLTVLINNMLKKSDNIIAGAIFKKIGQRYTQKPGSWERGSLAVSQILKDQSHVHTNGVKILDGSGLSPENQATPSQMMEALDFAYHHALLHDTLLTSLPISGVDGTLKHRMYPIAHKVRAKTGTIAGVVALAGFVESKNKEPLAFVIMINGYKGGNTRYKTLEDQIAMALTRYQRT
ncbi:MAG: hypothetical protein A3F43_06505 [Gammaproteobacteria bacterium RIFCSPHIGHO2_12_FULL_42_10]|nr:MAG: hypothetical protein A3F43_06505 [Gammaproteobacteria bacterium RIFCSPHIGHO2_12_FULL_42_10]